jgi:hypothetical protein
LSSFGAQLDGDWNEREQLISDAVRKDKERMEKLNEALATVSKIECFPCMCLTELMQRPPLTVLERPAQIKVTVAVVDRSTAGLVGHVTCTSQHRFYLAMVLTMYHVQSTSRSLPV